MGNSGSVHMSSRQRTGVVPMTTSPRKRSPSGSSGSTPRSPKTARFVIEDSEAESLRPNAFLGDLPNDMKAGKVFKSRSADHLRTPDFEAPKKKRQPTLNNIPSRIVRQLSFGSHKKIVIKDYTKEDQGNIEDNETIQFFFQKTGSESLDILFDSQVHGTDQRELLSRISYKKKLLFLFEHDEGMFGWYQSDFIKRTPPTETNHTNSETMFLFNYNKANNHYTMFERKNNEMKNALTIYSQTNAMLIDCFSAFWMDVNGIISFNPLLKKTYDIDPSIRHPFTHNKALNTKIRCDRFIVFQCL